MSGGVSHGAHGDDPRVPPAGLARGAVRPSAEELRARVASRLQGAVVEAIDDSHRHAGHAGAAGGAGHYTVRVTWAGFEGLARIARHRLVYDAVADWMPQRVHALVVTALTPAESGAR